MTLFPTRARLGAVARALAGAGALLFAHAAWADITIGVTLPLTGPASGLGIPIANQMKTWPATLAGEKVRLVILDDATDPTKGVTNAKRFVTEEKADLIIGSAATPVAIPVADVAMESGTPQLAMSPAVLPAGKDAWTFRMAQGNAVMAYAVVEHMKKLGVKTVGFLGYTDAYGESWLRDFQAESQRLGGPRIVATERFARTDTAVTAQALKLVSANPDAMLVVASGSGAAMPHKTLVERGYKGRIYQTHAAASRDLMRVGGKDVEGAYVVSGPAVVPEQLPASHPSKAVAQTYVNAYEKANGAGSRNQFAAHAYDAWIVLEKAVPLALAKAKPGTPQFRTALRDAIETMGRTIISQGVLQFSRDNHWGYTSETGVILKVVNGDWKIE
jgi:branched-chain amino acid transport system substrate-binding protein